MEFNYLPIGSIVTSKDVKDQELMICSYVGKGVKIKDQEYTYVCCLYPIGVGKDCFVLKRTDIDEVKFIGYQGTKFKQFLVDLEGDKNE